MTRSLSLAACCIALAACSSLEPRSTPIEPDTNAETDALAPTDAGADTAVDGVSGAADAWPTTWTVALAPTAPEAVGWAADDLVDYLGAMGAAASREAAAETVPECVPGEGAVFLLGDGLGTLEWETKRSQRTDQTYRIEIATCTSDEADTLGVRVTLAGDGLLGRQFAAYDWLHHLGVRFFHPEEEYVPDTLAWMHGLPNDGTPWAREHTPPFRANSVSLHLTHPLELGDAFRLGDPTFFPEAKRYIDWQIKNFASFGTSGVGNGELADYGHRRGFPRSAGFSLHNQQQGASAIIDPDDPRSEEAQIAEAIDARMGGPDADEYPEYFQFTFNPSEFTEIDDRDAVRQISFIADYIGEHYPDTTVLATNHTTAGEPTEHYGVRFYALPQFGPPNLGVKVHTVMFYDLFRPAPVYGNENFNFQYEFMVENYRERTLWHYPEAAWWLTFDIALPLYLPITVEARDRDIQGIAFMLEGGLEGHRTFGSGHEWGYWQNEYCALRMAADLNYRWRDCFADIAATTGPAADVVRAALERAVEIQERDLIYDEDLLAYVVGTDPETEIAASVGIVFHPLPPSPRAIMGWTVEEVDAWRDRIEPGLARMEADHAALVAQLDAVAETVPDAGRPWFDEIYDGLVVNMLRARHQREVYGALVTLRESRLRFAPDLAEDAEALLAAAEATTAEAIAVVARREQGYRYQPLDRSIAGGEDGTEDDNWTIYGYRYLNRTHHAYYYTRIDRLAGEVFAAGGNAVEVVDTMLVTGDDLVVRGLAEAVAAMDVDWGDGTAAGSGLDQTHAYASTGIYDAAVTGQTTEGEGISLDIPVAVVEAEFGTGFTGTIVEPSGAALIEAVMPALVVGRIDAATVALGFDVRGDGTVPLDGWSDLVASPDGLATEPADLLVPVLNREEARIVTSITVRDARVVVDEVAGTVTLTGSMVTEAVVQAVVDVGGFDEGGARAIIASALGYTADTLPEAVDFEVAYTVVE